MISPTKLTILEMRLENSIMMNAMNIMAMMVKNVMMRKKHMKKIR